MNRIIRWITSVRLAIALIAWLGASSIVATLVPQQQDQAFYADRYPRLLA